MSESPPNVVTNGCDYVSVEHEERVFLGSSCMSWEAEAPACGPVPSRWSRWRT